MKGPDEKIYFYELLIKAYEGRLSPDEVKQLNERIQSDDEAAYLYAEFFDTLSGLADINEKVFSFEDNDSTKLDVWLNCLAHDEKAAPAVEIPLSEEPRVLIEKVRYQKVDHKINRGSLFTLFAAAAATILIFVFAYFVPATGFKVAVLSDSINAKWTGVDGKMEKGTPILTGHKSLLLQEGYVKLLFDNDAQVTIEGPAEFQVRTEDQIKLRYGRLYAVVPREAIGFSVYTQNAKIIDLGTEFGVQADISGDTSLYVVHGKTTLIAGEKSMKDAIEVNAGMAKRVSGSTLDVSDVTFRQELFVREINSQSNAVWKGQMKIDLADIVGGGNGFGTGKFDMGLDPVNGVPVKALTSGQAATNEYHPVSSNPYVDGIFVPNGRTKQIVSSQGHIFQECPVSGGGWYISMLNTIRILDPQTTPDLTISGSPVAHCILMHANLGITYDLQAIRSSLPKVNIVRFQSKFGVGKEMDRPCNADFWILVDGKVRYKKTQVKEKTLFAADIELSEKDRFLTLVTTDGQDPEGRTYNNMPLTPYDSDWCFFADPVLILE